MIHYSWTNVSTGARTFVRRKLTRRQAIAIGTGTSAAIAGGVWLNRSGLRYILEPLPAKRSVALMAWPPSEFSAVVLTVLDSIGQRLARAEAYVKDLLIITLNDLPANTAVPTVPTESVSSMGANLVLAASLQSLPSRVSLMLQVLDANNLRVLRKARVVCLPEELSSLSEKAENTAAKLLGLPLRETSLKDTDELRRISADTFRVFSEAEQLANEPNDAGLEASILKYQQALEMDPHFALGYARLAMAYIKKYLLDSEQAELKLAQSNTTLSLRYNPGSAKGLLSQALVFLYFGKTNEALDFFARSLKADPDNPETLLYKAQALRNTSQWPRAQQVYEDILKDRPNYWPAYNELGWILSRQAKYQEAADAFDAAASAAPKVALPLANLGSVYLDLGKRAEAIDACNRSLLGGANSEAYLTLGDIAFTDGKYEESRSYYVKASALDPKYHLIWRNIGDCDAMLGKPLEVQKNYEKAARLLSDNLK